MDVNRMLYVVYYKGKGVVNRLERLPINIAFISNKLNYALFYGEKDSQKTYYNHLKNIKGFNKIEQSPLFDEELNYSF